MRLEKITKFWLIGTITIIFIGIVLHGPISVGLSSLWPDFDLLIKAWKEIMMILAVIPFAIEMTRLRMWPRLFKDKLSLVLVGYILLNLLMLLINWSGFLSSMAGLLINLRFVGFFLLVYWTLKMYPENTDFFRKLFFIGVGIVAIFGVLQVTILPKNTLEYIGYSIDTIPAYHTIDSDDDFVRIGSTLRGPNPLGAYMVIAMTAIIGFLLSRSDSSRKSLLISVILLILSAITLVASYSRSAWVGLVIAVAILFILKFGRRITKWTWVGLAAVLTVATLGVYMFRDNAVVSSVIFHESFDSNTSVKSDDQRIQSWAGGLERVIESPLGGGVGSTGTPSFFTDNPLVIENQFLYVAHETGWAGLVLFTISICLVMFNLWIRRSEWFALAIFSSGVGLLFIGLIQPVWVDDTVSIIWWGMSAVCLASRPTLRRSDSVSDL